MRLLKEEPTFEDSDGKVLLGSSLFSRSAPKKQFKKGINEFIDLTDDEFSKFYLLPRNALYRPQNRPFKTTPRDLNSFPSGNSFGRFL